MTELLQATHVYSPIEVPAVLADGGPKGSISTGYEVDLQPVLALVQKDQDAGKPLIARTDAEYAELIHTALRKVARRVLLDPKTWHWLTLGPLQTYTLARWCDRWELGDPMTLTTSQQGRFVGRSSLAGMAGNSIARLYWGADAAWQNDGNYERVPTIFANSDLYVGIFERELGLAPGVAVLLAERLKDEPELPRRNVLVNLNFVLSTTALEALDMASLGSLLDELLLLESE